MERVVFDTDLYIDWLQDGAREELMVSGPFLRHMSAVVLMELRAGAFTPQLRALSKICTQRFFVPVGY